MRYGNDDQARASDVEAARKRSQRFVQLGLMRKRDLVTLYDRMMRERGSTTLVGGPITAQDYRSAISCMERSDEVAAAHLAEYGPGHERCPMVNFEAVCEAAKPVGETAKRSQEALNAARQRGEI